jgi:hypothetical protein
MAIVFITGVSEGVPLQAQNQDQKIRPVVVPAYHEFFRFLKSRFSHSALPIGTDFVIENLSLMFF